MDTIELTSTFLMLGDQASLAQVEGGASFWARLATDRTLLAELNESWLVSAHPTASDWTSWERHPAGDEVIVAVGGSFTVHTEHPESRATETTGLRAGQTVVMPAGVWHTVDVDEPGEILTITAGRGTEHRDR